jgi:hypothetical protein
MWGALREPIKEKKNKAKEKVEEIYVSSSIF